MALCGVVWRYVVFVAEYDVISRYLTSCDVIWGYVALFSVMLVMWRYVAFCFRI